MTYKNVFSSLPDKVKIVQMKQRISLLLGIYVVMALSNAVVPVLPLFADEAPVIQSAIFSAYFLGAFITVFPAGLLSDRIGKTPLIRMGLILTLFSGILIILFPSPLPVILARTLEGVGAGMFVACALSWVNSQEDHSRLSGFFFAALNLGLVTGLIAAGWLEKLLGFTGGIMFFTVFSVIPLALTVFFVESEPIIFKKANVFEILRSYKWLYLSSVVLIGVTGVIATLYPEFTDQSPVLLSIQIGIMNVATMITSLIAPQCDLKPIATIRVGALIMAFAVIASYFTPSLGEIPIMIVFSVIGGVAGFIIIAQMEFLANTHIQQGTLMGLFNTATYAGMTFLPFFAGVLAEYVNYFSAFFVMAVITLSIAYFIGRCNCNAFTQE